MQILTTRVGNKRKHRHSVSLLINFGSEMTHMFQQLRDQFGERYPYNNKGVYTIELHGMMLSNKIYTVMTIRVISPKYLTLLHLFPEAHDA